MGRVGKIKDENELLFLKSKETITEVTGWKVFIFLPQHISWRFFMIIVILTKCVINVTRAIYLKEPYLFRIVDFTCDLVYYMDVILSTLHFAMKRTSRLRYGPRRHGFFLILDYVSMLPLGQMYVHTVYNTNEKNQRVTYMLNLVGVLRVYQVPKNFSDIKDSMYNVNYYLLMTIFQLLSYVLILTHFLSCFLFLYFDEKLQRECLNSFSSCVIQNFVETYYLLGQCYITPFMNYPLSEYTALLSVDLFLGYIFTYGFVAPMVLFVCTKYLTNCFDNSRRLKHVNVMVENYIRSKKLKKKVMEHFQALWAFGRYDKQPELLSVFPLCFRKKLFCDMHWDAMRHSYLLQDISIGCKRSMALCMRTQFLLPSTRLFEKDIHYNCFLYLESGLLQVMAEENIRTPVLSLSSGTMFGEVSFFLHPKSKATVQAARYSIIHTLSFRDFFAVLMDYPSDKKKIFSKFKARLKLAKSMHEIKTNMYSHFVAEEESNVTREEIKRGNIKWLKNQYRSLTELKRAEKLLHLHQYSVDDYERLVFKLDTQTKHTSVCLPYITINDEKVNKHGAVCLKKFPWLMDPLCQFVSIWNWIIYTTISITYLLYPCYTAWYESVPHWFFCLSCVVTLLYIVDISLTFSTAVRIKNVTVKKFSTVFIQRITQILFIADIGAAVPLQFVACSYKVPFLANMFFLNALLKGYHLIPVINRLNYNRGALVFVRTVTKYMLILLFLIYFSASMFYLSGIKCVFFDCGDHDWHDNLVEEVGEIGAVNSAVLKALYLAYEIPEEDTRTSVLPSYLLFWASFFVIHNFFFALKGECTAAYVLELSADVEHKVRMDYIYNFMGLHKIVGNVRNRVMSAMEFQWIYDKNNYITGKNEVWESMSEQLKVQFEYACTLPIVSRVRLFESENEEFLLDVCRCTDFLVLPENSVLFTLGTQTTRLYIIQKGYVQINSFIQGDLHFNTSRPMKATTGDIFPVIDVLSQTPASVTGVTVSDCELLVIELEDLLSVMMRHGNFKDFVDSIKETDLSKLNTAKLGVTTFRDVFSTGGIPYQEFFDALQFLKSAAKCLLMKNAVNSHSLVYLYWEVSRVILILINVIAWPIALGCCYRSKIQRVLFQILCYTEFLSFVDFYFRLHVAYYNKRGIYVSHTVSTAIHYLVTAFISDLIAFSPNVHILQIIICKEYDLEWFVMIVHMTLRSFSLYRIIGFLRFLKFYGKVIYQTNIILTIFFLCLFTHYYICIMVHLYTVKMVNAKFRLTKYANLTLNNSLKMYANEVGLILTLSLRGIRFINEYDVSAIAFNMVVASLGLIGQIWLFSHITLASTTANKKFTTYQYYMQSFINYLSSQKAEEKVINEAVDHFEYEWKKHMGNNLKETLENLPVTLHEDISYPLYKMTLAGVVGLLKANDCFYRTISRNVEEMYLKEGFVVLFNNEVQSNIYFIHSGQCSVENGNLILYKGAMIGDIKGKGIMTNTITARTDLKLLKIPSVIFFQTLNNFYFTKLAYESELDHADDFLVSIYTTEYNMPPIAAEKEVVECEFMLTTDGQEGEGVKKKKRRGYWKYDSKMALFFRFIFMLVAYSTVILIPIFVAIRLFTPVILSIIYALDLLWIIKIIMFGRMVGPDKLQPNKGKKFKRFTLFWNILFHILTVFPIEVIPLIYCGLPISNTCCSVMCFCYMNRMLRVFFILIYFKHKGGKLLENFFMKVLGILMLKIALINLSCAIYIIITPNSRFEYFTCYKRLDSKQVDSLISSYLCVLNDFVGAGMDICLPESGTEVAFQLFITIWAMLSKILLINHVLMIMYVTHHNKSNQMVQLEQLNNYLLARDVSSPLRAEAQKYYSYLLNSFYEGGDIAFLNSAPSSIRTSIMENIYSANLRNCFVFRDIDETFLKQLTTRLTLNIFFPGDYITEKGDVDHNMYFIKEGEVYCIQTHNIYKALETATDVYTAGTSFGIQQGILSAFPHTQTYRAKTLTNILILNFHKWEDLRSAFPETYDTIYKLCLQLDTKLYKQQ